jgi:hypothetical protein
MALIAAVAAVAVSACGGGGGGGGGSTSTSRAGGSAQDAVRLLDSWQKPILDTLDVAKRRQAADLRGDRDQVDRLTLVVDRSLAPVLQYSEQGRVFAARAEDPALGRAVRTAGDKWTFWAIAVKRARPVPHVTPEAEQRASDAADRGAAAIHAFAQAYIAAGRPVPPAFRGF